MKPFSATWVWSMIDLLSAFSSAAVFISDSWKKTAPIMAAATVSRRAKAIASFRCIGMFFGFMRSSRRLWGASPERRTVPGGFQV